LNYARLGSRFYAGCGPLSNFVAEKAAPRIGAGCLPELAPAEGREPEREYQRRWTPPRRGEPGRPSGRPAPHSVTSA